MAAATNKFVAAKVAVLVLVAVMLAVQANRAEAQASCTGDLTNLNVCAPFVVPGAANTVPNSECCGALQSVNHDCICNTLRIAANLPSQCNLPPLTCGN